MVFDVAHCIQLRGQLLLLKPFLKIKMGSIQAFPINPCGILNRGAHYNDFYQQSEIKCHNGFHLIHKDEIITNNIKRITFNDFVKFLGNL